MFHNIYELPSGTQWVGMGHRDRASAVAAANASKVCGFEGRVAGRLKVTPRV